MRGRTANIGVGAETLGKTTYRGPFTDKLLVELILIAILVIRLILSLRLRLKLSLRLRLTLRLGMRLELSLSLSPTLRLPRTRINLKRCTKPEI